MKKVYTIDGYRSSTKNGIGRYIQELSNALITLKIDTSIIEINSESQNVELKNKGDIKRICIPNSSNYFVSNSFVVACLLKMHITDAAENIFILNYSPCKPLIKTLRKYFPLSKIVFVIHDLSWTSPLLGNEKLFQEIMMNREDKSIQEKHGHIIESINIVK